MLNAKKGLRINFNKNKSRFFFRHKNLKTKCPLIEEKDKGIKNLDSLIHARMRESPEHKNLKYTLAHILEIDNRFINIQAPDSYVYGYDGSHKQHDVYAEFDNKRIAFEVQLSRITPDNIIERFNFYKKNNIYLVWIFDKFDLETIRAYGQSIFKLSNYNVFILNEDAILHSSKNKELFLECVWRENKVNDKGEISWNINNKLFNFNDLKFDNTRFVVYNHDFLDTEKLNIENLLFKTWREKQLNQWDDKTAEEIIKRYYGILLDSSGRENLAKLLHTIISVSENKSYGWKFNNILQIFHILFDSCKSLCLIFLCSCIVFNRVIIDKNKKSKLRIDEIKSSISLDKQNTSPYLPNAEHLAVIRRIFPPLYDELVLAINNIENIQINIQYL